MLSNQRHLNLRGRRCFQTFNPFMKFGGTNAKKQPTQGSIADVVNGIVNNHFMDSDLPPKWERLTNRFLTSPKRLIVKDVSDVVRRLRCNDFVEKSGSASRLIYGEKGIGKSSALTLAVMGSWICYNNVISIYMEYIGSAKEYQAPSAALAKCLDLQAGTSMGDCIEELKKRNIYALIIADEIEQVYTGIDFPDQRRLVLDDLAELGSQASGRTYTYICGSSSLAPVLISKNAVHSEELRNEFPFVMFAPILNGKKFVGLRVHRGLQGNEDLDIVKRVYNLSDSAANLVYYLCGSNLRTVDQVVSAMKSAAIGCQSQELIRSIKERCDTIGQWDQRAIKTRSKDGALIDALLNKMVTINYRLVKRAAQDPGQISAINWINELKAISHDEIMSVCAEVDIKDPEYAVNLLVDKGYFSGPPHLAYLLPNKPSELVDYFPSYKTWLVKIVTKFIPIASRFFATSVLPGLNDIAIKAAIDSLK